MRGLAFRWVTCYWPLRGGVALDDKNSVSCTAGFNAIGSGAVTGGPARGEPVVFTAGHCLVLSNKTLITGSQPPGLPWQSYDAQGFTREIRSTSGGRNWEYDAGGDWAWLENTNNAYWEARPWVYAGESQPEYSISRDSSSRMGWTLCLTSGIPLSTPSSGEGIPDPATNQHFACGKVIGLNKTACYENIEPVECVEHLGKLKLQDGFGIVDGSSGGPVFNNHHAFGLVSGSGSPGTVFYQGIRYAERTAGAFVGGG